MVLTTHLMDELRVIVPTVELAEVDCSGNQALRAHAEALGFATRIYAGQLILLLQKRLTIHELIAQLAPTEIRSVRLRAITLNDVFLETVSTHAA